MAKRSSKRPLWSRFFLLPVGALLSILLITHSVTARAQSARALSEVNKIYVEPLGQGKLGEEFRNRVLNQLRKKGHLVIVESARQADAVMSGTAEVWLTGHSSLSPRSPSTTVHVVYSGFLSARIVGEDKHVLWSYLVTPSRFAWGGIVNDLADNLTAKLLEARKQGEEGIAVIPPSDAGVLALHGAGATFPGPLYRREMVSIHSGAAAEPADHLRWPRLGGRHRLTFRRQSRFCGLGRAFVGSAHGRSRNPGPAFRFRTRRRRSDLQSRGHRASLEFHSRGAG